MAVPEEPGKALQREHLAENLGAAPPIERQSDFSAAPKFPIVIAEFDRNAREKIRITLDTYAGRHTIDVRVWWRDGSKLKPGKTGITTAVTNLPALAAGLTLALGRARQLGIVD